MKKGASINDSQSHSSKSSSDLSLPEQIKGEHEDSYSHENKSFESGIYGKELDDLCESEFEIQYKYASQRINEF
jgi:hypothetical protein